MSERPRDIEFQKTYAKVAVMSESDMRVALVTARDEIRRAALARAYQSVLIALDELRLCSHEPEARAVYDALQKTARKIGDLQ